MVGLSKGVLFLFLLAAVAGAQNVRITWVGQACFYVQTEGGSTVVVDPPGANVGYALPTTPADVVAISHNHGDHNNSAGVVGNFTLVDGRPTTERTEITAAGVPVVLIPGFHDNTNGTARGRNTIVQWTQGGLRFAHFGDYGQDALTEAQLADLRNLDVLMIPAGGFFTIDNQGSARVIEQVRPRIAILMHFRTALGGPAQLPMPPAVASPFPDVRYKPSSVILSRSTVPASEVWVMEPAADAVAVNAAGFSGGVPVAPGSIASLFGNFTGSTTSSFSSFPLPAKLGETDVLIGTQAVPLFFASPNQINFQVPGSLGPTQSAFEVRVAGQRVARGSITTVPRSPGLFAVVDQNGRLGRARRGQSIIIFGTGQGVVTPAIADGAAAPPQPFSMTGTHPGVYVGGREAAVSFSGLAPGYSGLWQINAQVPQDAPSGDVGLVVLYDLNLVSNVLSLTVE